MCLELNHIKEQSESLLKQEPPSYRYESVKEWTDGQTDKHNLQTGHLIFSQ